MNNDDLFNPQKIREQGARLATGLKNSLFTFAGAAIVIVVIFISFTDIKVNPALAFATITLNLAIIWFCQYSMFINYFAGGQTKGRQEQIYIDAVRAYNDLKAEILASDTQSRIPDYCEWWTKNELEMTRKNSLADCGIKYDEYCAKYLGRSKKQIQALDLPELTKEVIIATNKIKAVPLTSDQLLRAGTHTASRKAVRENPKKKANFLLCTKLVASTVTATVTAFIGIDLFAEVTLATVALMLIRLLVIVINGFNGYINGFNLVTVDMVGYTNDQIDQLKQFAHWVLKENKEDGNNTSVVGSSQSGD